MPIIITGAAGFVGRVLVRRLLDGGADIVALDSSTAALADHPALCKVTGDIASPAVRAEALRDGCNALIHLATVPGGAAEADPAASRRINVDAMYDLLLDACAAGVRPRIVFASSIAALGDPLPLDRVDDTTPLAPRMVSGGHNAMMEVAVARCTIGTRSIACWCGCRPSSRDRRSRRG